jgi:aerobic-type carbon monoxide dehydrogenase small subunit (CoxS/CutS family)
MHSNTKRLTLTVNGKKVTAEVNPRMTLAEFLREELDLIGTKVGCNRGECGSCTVVLDGKAVYSCSILAIAATGRDVITVEGLTTNCELHPLQKAFIENDALQCGYCTPGMLMSLTALLMTNLNPTEQDIRTAIEGNACRCGCFPNIIQATIEAARQMRKNKEKVRVER